MGTMASQITSLTIVYSTVYSGAEQRKHQIKLPVTGLCAGNSPGIGEFPHKQPVTQKIFPFDDVIMIMCMLWGNFSTQINVTHADHSDQLSTNFHQHPTMITPYCVLQVKYI